MKTLCLVRHASSDKEAKTDYTRTLNRRGSQDAKSLAMNLKKETGLRFDKIVSSPAIRSFETALIFLDKLAMGEEKIDLKDTLYNLDPGFTLMEVINSIDDSSDSVMIIGHNPSIENTARILVDGFQHNFYTTSALCIHFMTDSWKKITAGSGNFVFYKFNRFNPNLSRLDKMIAQSIKSEIYSRIESSLKEIETSLLSADLNDGEYESEKLAEKVYQKTDIITIRSLAALSEEIKNYETKKKLKIESKIHELDKALNNFNKKIQVKNGRKVEELEKKREKLLKRIPVKPDESPTELNPDSTPLS